jgi:hypothetical protein
MKKRYDRAEYKNRKLLTPYDHWEDVWSVFQETIDRAGLDNSMGDSNYLIGRYIYEKTKYDKKEFIATIEQYLKENEAHD